ncbi:serine/threonine-protein phosphatase 4 catalytic subunit-like isoform X2 [Temnothorax curvispinosus]|uniref:Serine/threonine-protein phosphatase 4 catalytic subunit-like isoform X2 n=1 Tax=Temnothorax curvispinosus TaxID=300111 RepID=A0A6J1RAH0_9HYME|nr:serine/threonine-protein phosphatase 4 catalytic subunit-like isoform X2 [Temnothorax curvispinosus]
MMAKSSDLDWQIEQLKKCKIIKEAEVKVRGAQVNLCAKASEILIEESKVRYPDRITLVRGNHESREITQQNVGSNCLKLYWKKGIGDYISRIST